MILWHNGKYEDISSPLIQIGDRGFQFGDGVFDTMIANDGHAIDKDLHFERLVRHAEMIHLKVGLSRSEFSDVIKTLIAKNGDQNYRIKTVCSAGTTGKALHRGQHSEGSITITATPYTPTDEGYTPLLCISKIRRNETSPLSRIKSLNYGDNILAREEAASLGTDDAILLNTVGKLACTTIANIYLRLEDDGTLLTPPQEDGAMNGIMRAKFLKSGQAIEHSLPYKTLSQAKEIWISNSVLGLRQARLID